MPKAPSTKSTNPDKEQPATPAPETIERPLSPPDAVRTPKDLQRLAASGQGEDMINVQLIIDGSDADGVRAFNESLPANLVRAILDPEVADFFIPIKGSERMKSPRVKSHWLHTSYIREILLLNDLPGMQM